MRAIGNVLWFVLGGALMGLAWWLVGLVAYPSIVSKEVAAAARAAMANASVAALRNNK
jgi:uncharacterized membrane protein YccF (DUF307 family)